MKISTYLFLKTDPNELLLMTDIPNLVRPWRSLTALIETDWYPASYPWHTVIELDPREKKITIKKGEPLCRLIPVRRDLYAAGPMAGEEFDQFFTDGQDWLTKNSRGIHDGVVDIRGRYVRGQKKPKFVVAE
jgi:hypothetical protein